MSTVAPPLPLVHWFPSLGFRPAVIEVRQDFAGRTGWNEHILVARDANEIFGGKSILGDPSEDLVLVEVPPSFTPPPLPPSIFTIPPDRPCCTIIVPPKEPPVVPPVIPLGESGIYLLTGVVLFIALRQARLVFLPFRS